MKKRVPLRLAAVLVLALVLTGASQSVQADTYLVYNQVGGTWHDANKTWADDSQLCWAAAAANLLAWTGWGFPPGQSFGSEQDILAYFSSHLYNRSGGPEDAVKWWFDGLTTYQVKTPGGGFWTPAYSVSDYTHLFNVTATGVDPMDGLAARLQQGQGVALTIGQDFGSHLITLWGYEYSLNLDGTRHYQGLYITDSDDGPTPTLTYYSIFEETLDAEYINSTHILYLEDYYGADWRVFSGFSLDAAPSAAVPVPLPHTVFLLVSGLAGLGICRRRPLGR